MSTTGLAWILTNPLKPYALFDSNAIRNVPIDFNEWLADIGSTYASHEIICADGMQCLVSSESLGIITAEIRTDPGVVLRINTKYAVTWRIIAANGEQDDRTFYFKVTNR